MKRRHLIIASTGAAAGLCAPAGVAWAQSRRALPSMTEGPFYPPVAWRQRETDWDADLTQTTRGGSLRVARGEHLGLELTVVDAKGSVVDGAEVEIWQCDVLAAYRHPSVRSSAEQMDEGFQGFGVARSARDGAVAFRSIKPVAYPGRTPHIHIKLRHASFGEFTSQLFIAGDSGNARDFLWRQMNAGEREAADMKLQAAAADSANPLRWRVAHRLLLPA
jgi:protocatechuate 3,4-dioxygenase, beta subunit